MFNFAIEGGVGDRRKGYIDNGIIKGNNSVLTVMSQVPAIGLKVLIAGTWNNAEVYDSWFDFDNSPNFISNRIIENILLLTDDFHFCHIYFQADRNYFLNYLIKGKQISVINYHIPWLVKLKKKICRFV